MVLAEQEEQRFTNFIAEDLVIDYTAPKMKFPTISQMQERHISYTFSVKDRAEFPTLS